MLHNSNILQLFSLDLIVLGLFILAKIYLYIARFFSRSPTRNDTILCNSTISNRLRRTLGSRSMSAEVFHSSMDTGHNVSSWKNE